MGQSTFETRAFYLILAEKLITLPAGNDAAAVGSIRRHVTSVVLNGK